MFCTKCGKQIQEGAAFCSNCGQKTGGLQIASEPQQQQPVTNAASNSGNSQQVPITQPSQQPNSPLEFLGNPSTQTTPQPVSSAPQFDFDYQSQSPASIGMHGTEILTLDTQSLFKVMEKALSIINSYLDEKINYDNYQGIKNWCNHIQTLPRTSLFKKVVIESPEDYGSSEDVIEIYNVEKDCCKLWPKNNLITVFGAPDGSNPDGSVHTALDRVKAFTAAAMKQENLPTDLLNAENDFKNAERNLNNEIETIKMIPPAYRSPTALKTMMFYLSNLRAKTWEEAAAQFDMQVSIWKLNDSDEFDTMRVEILYLKEESIGTAAISSELFSELSHFIQ